MAQALDYAAFVCGALNFACASQLLFGAVSVVSITMSSTHLNFALFDQVKGSHPPGRPSKIWNDSTLSDCQGLNINVHSVMLQTSQPGETGLVPHT